MFSVELKSVIPAKAGMTICQISGVIQRSLLVDIASESGFENE
jgi:hypothetical protein